MAPPLIEHADLRGAFHNHTTASDGRNTLAEMVAAADALGWEYIGIADHSKSSVIANGLSEERLLRQVAEIRALNESGRFRAHVFAGVECDILPDGSLGSLVVRMAEGDALFPVVSSSAIQRSAPFGPRPVDPRMPPELQALPLRIRINFTYQ